jgi:predicted transcriptional regulator
MNYFNTEDVAQNKLLILYILNSSPKNFTNAELTEFILEKGYMNYFILQQYISELIDGQLIEIETVNDSEVYNVLEKGIITLDLFQSKIPEKIIQELTDEFRIQELLKVRETQIVGDCYPKENNQYTVNLKLIENEETLFSLYLDVASEEQGKKFCKLWKEKTEVIYQKILNIFIKADI